MAFWDSGTGVGHRPPCWEARRWDTDICSTPMDTGLLLPDVVSTGSGSGCQHPAGLLDAVLPYVPCNPPGNWGVEPNSGSNPPISPNARGRSLENPNPIGFCEKFFLLGRGRESPTLCALGHGQEPGPPPVYATTGPTGSSPIKAAPSQAGGSTEQPAALLQPRMAKAAGAFCVLLLLITLCYENLAQSEHGHPGDWGQGNPRKEGGGAWGWVCFMQGGWKGSGNLQAELSSRCPPQEPRPCPTSAASTSR